MEFLAIGIYGHKTNRHFCYYPLPTFLLFMLLTVINYLLFRILLIDIEEYAKSNEKKPYFNYVCIANNILDSPNVLWEEIKSWYESYYDLMYVVIGHMACYHHKKKMSQFWHLLFLHENYFLINFLLKYLLYENDIRDHFHKHVLVIFVFKTSNYQLD